VSAAAAEVRGVPIVRRTPLHGGCIAAVARLDLEDGRSVVEKRARPGDATDLSLEAWMLRYLAEKSDLPVPEVLEATPERLVMTYVPHDVGGPKRAAEIDAAADKLVALHAISAERFGLERDTLIGPLPQPNGEMASWVAFFRERRLFAMTRRADAAGRLPAGFAARLERLAGKLDDLLVEPVAPALLHGDAWSGNLLFRGERIVAFLDPAVYFGHPEIELAFTTLFGPFGDTFYAAYAERAGIASDFFEVRADLYNLYPLLVHVHLFGSGYLAPIDRTLCRHGV
jgi:fructosamine-3-kinase